MKGWVRRGREGGREVEGEAYTSDTLLMKPLTAKQRKQQEQKKNPLKPSDKLKNMRDSSQTDAAKTHVMIKSTISRKRLHLSCNTFCSLKTFIEVSFPTLKCTKHSFHLFYAKILHAPHPSMWFFELERQSRQSLLRYWGSSFSINCLRRFLSSTLSLSARSHVLSFLIWHPNIRSKMIGSPSSYLSLLKPST